MQNEKFLNYELSLDFSPSDLQDLTGNIKVSVCELKKVVFDNDRYYSIVGGTVVGNPNYIVAGMRMDEDFALAFIGVESNQIFFSTIVSPVVVLDHYGSLGQKSNKQTSFCSRVLDIKEVEELENPKLFNQIGEKLQNGTITMPENAAYSFLAEQSHLGSELYNYYRENVKVFIQQAILNFIMYHDYSEIKQILGAKGVSIDRTVKKLVKKLKQYNSEEVYYKLLDRLDELDDKALVLIFNQLQNHEDEHIVFEDFETDIFLDGLRNLLVAQKDEF